MVQPLGNFRCYATLTVDVDANWKTIADGFSETYHIQTLHPELLRCVDDIHAPQQIWGHTGKSDQPYGVQSPRFDGALTDEEVWDAYVDTQGALMGAAEGTPLPPLTPARADRAGPDRRAAPVRSAAERGVDLGWADTDRITRLHQYNVFPNMSLLANADHLTVMCSRPGPTPEQGELVMFLMTRMPPGAPRTKPADVRDDAPSRPNPGLVSPRTSGCSPGLQRGLHSARLHPPRAVQRGAARDQHAPQPGALPRPARIRADDRRLLTLPGRSNI